MEKNNEENFLSTKLKFFTFFKTVATKFFPVEIVVTRFSLRKKTIPTGAACGVTISSKVTYELDLKTIETFSSKSGTEHSFLREILQIMITRQHDRQKNHEAFFTISAKFFDKSKRDLFENLFIQIKKSHSHKNVLTAVL